MRFSEPRREAASGGAGDPLGEAGLSERIAGFVFAGEAHPAVAAIVEGLAPLPRAAQELALHWADVAAQSYGELGILVAERAPEAIGVLGHDGFAAWVRAALERFDRVGGRAALDALRDLEGFRDGRGRAAGGVRLADVEARLVRFVQGLAGRSLAVAASADGSAWTDTETIFLPAELAGHADAADRRALYRLHAALLWGQARFGTFNADAEPTLAAWPDPGRALGWLAVLEAIRIESCLGRELPGLAAELAAARPPWSAELAAAVAALSRPEAGVADALDWLDRLRRQGAAGRDAPLLPLAGRIDFAAARRVRAARIERDTGVVRRALRAAGGGAEARPQLTIPDVEGGGATIDIRLDGVALALPPDAQAALRSLVQDLGAVPPEALVAAGPAPWSPTGRPGDGVAALPEGEADVVHDEWDYRRGAFRTGWCRLREHPVEPGDPGYAAGVRQRHRALVGQLRRRFEALRGEDRVLRRQPDGEDIDLDACVGARADRRAGAVASPDLYTRRMRTERSLAVLFMVDMSGSTQGWVNDAEREALILLGEAVETLGDAWAIYGFSGWTRTRCDLYRIKSFAEPYGAAVERRIAGIAAKDYTRMGVAIRHLGGLLAAQPARHRLLVTLSDGKPDDFADEYRSQYGIEDTRHALLEVASRGVRSFCVTIDRHGADYLGHMYGPARYAVLDDVRQLPLKIADIYRRLAT